MTQVHQEKAFQAEIAQYLEQHGWLHSPDSSGYDKQRALFPEDVLAWLAETQPENFRKIVPEGGVASSAAVQKAQARILDRIAKTLALPESQGGGTLRLLRRGFDLAGARRFDMMTAPPADDRNPQLTAKYKKNRLRVVQEVVYSESKADRIDLVLFLNGIPVATIELKTDLTQSVGDAVAQYKRDRRPEHEPLLTYGRGALVHFAVSDSDIQMTTHLEGEATRFLPFNKGHNNGAGNPPVDGDARTSYLWREILDLDTWLTIISKFIYVNHDRTTDPLTGKQLDKTQIRFPRYHQWRSVTRLVDAARQEGPGHKYLVQHSAGSGKTDSIAWTAHRLASLHTAAGDKIFDSIIVIADRQVLDRQLQDAVDQLVVATGQFQAVTRGSEGSKTTQLIDALESGVQIIGVTLQTFPHALAKMREDGGSLAGKKFAVVVDEAHSSQSGNAAKAVKETLYLNDEAKEPAVDENDLGDPDFEPAGADQDVLNAMAAHADQDQKISFLAFTATPKAKTLELFGRPGADGTPEPFDLYSMKQAIEEGFILDVLKNYTTYEMAARIAQRANEDGGSEEIDVRRGTRAYIGLVELHPTNVASKVAEILTHFTTTVQHQLGGRAKAMVVTSSRKAAVQYQRAFTRAIAQRGLDVHTLVAFSGQLPNPAVEQIPGVPSIVPDVSEASENRDNPGFRGGAVDEAFHQEGQHILIVANKYQTGFDEPLLVAMYVDKQLSGISAVQTLSRLNRIAPGKTDTYVLDFVNDPQEVLRAFQTYYEDATIETESDPDLVADLLGKLEGAALFTWAEVDRTWDAWSVAGGELKGAKGASGHNAVMGCLAPAIDRFAERWKSAVARGDKEGRERLEEFRDTLGSYVKAYSFFSQLIHFGDSRYEKLGVFSDLLGRSLRGFGADDPGSKAVDVSDVVLTHYKLEKVRQETLELHAGEGQGLQGMTEAGLAREAERKTATQTELIEKVNHYFGDLTDNPDYAVGTIDLINSEITTYVDLREQALHNSDSDLRSSPTLRTEIENALFREDSTSNAVRERLQEMPYEQLLELLEMAGLFSKLRGEESV
jgi:type I restriction enzyme R subunit